jgi:hypothetical protein
MDTTVQVAASFNRFVHPNGHSFSHTSHTGELQQSTAQSQDGALAQEAKTSGLGEGDEREARKEHVAKRTRAGEGRSTKSPTKWV